MSLPLPCVSAATPLQLHYDLSLHSPHSDGATDDVTNHTFLIFHSCSSLILCLCLTTHLGFSLYPLTLYGDVSFSSSTSQLTCQLFIETFSDHQAEVTLM